MLYRYKISFGGAVYSGATLNTVDLTYKPNYSSDESIQFADSQLEYSLGANESQSPSIEPVGDDENGYLYRNENNSDHSYYLVIPEMKKTYRYSINWFKILKTYREYRQ